MEYLINQIFSDKKIVVISGAGISTLSGILDFRGNNGLYIRINNAEYKLSIECLCEEPEEFYNFYVNNMIFNNIKPNIIHETLAKLEDKGYIDYIITQNVDGLHQKAGSKRVVELHGNGDNFYCRKCNVKYNVDDYINNGYKCLCDGIIRPDVVLYGEPIKQKDRLLALKKIIESDLLLVLGSSLTVSTINNLLNEFIRINNINSNSDKIIIINDKETIYDNYATKYSEDLEDVFKKIKKYI